MKKINIEFKKIPQYILELHCTAFFSMLGLTLSWSSMAMAEDPIQASVKKIPSVFSVKSSGSPAYIDSNIKMKTSGVPAFEIYQKKTVQGKTEVYKVKNIPRINIGNERSIQSDNLSPLVLPEDRQVQLAPKKILPSVPILPEVLQKTTNPIAELTVIEARPLVQLQKGNSEVQKNNFAATNEVLLPLVKTKLISEKPSSNRLSQDLAPNDYKLLQALIFLEVQKKYELAMGLFAELLEDPKYRVEALYYYALTAKGLDLRTEFRHFMVQVIKETQTLITKENSLMLTWQEKALLSLVENVLLLEKSDIAFIDPYVEKLKLDVSTKEDFQITRAKYYSDAGRLDLVEDALSLIPETSKYYNESEFLKALSKYRQGQLPEAQIHLHAVLQKTESTKTLPLRSLAALTLARIQFQQNKYKESFQSYLLIDKTSTFWLQAMIESSWTQILAEDYEGAAGNMFSLHTDFFRNAFLPESYIVRTVGYLNLCQYGDGAQVLQDMQRKFSPWKKRLNLYRSTIKESIKYYDTVKTWIKNSDLKEIDGLPRSFIVELASDPSFLNSQRQINDLEDEVSKFNKVALSLVAIEKESLIKKNIFIKELIELKRKANTKNSPSNTVEQMAQAEKNLISIGIQYRIANKARNSIKNIRAAALSRIDSEKSNHRLSASMALEKHFSSMFAGLSKYLDQTEVLKYEMYSGAGEHIRFQLAGGQLNDKEHPELKVQEEKSLNWKFKGEFWEDEIGHYRSSLKNVCPQESNIAENSK